MNQRTHAWIAVRTIALLEDSGKDKNLVKLLKPHAAKAAIGAWIPDLQDAKRGGGKTENHIFKIGPYKGIKALKERFITTKADMLDRLGSARLMRDYIDDNKSLKTAWWNKPYKGDVKKPGQHLANRAMALSVMMQDLLIMGEDTVDKLLPGKVSFAKHIDKHARTQQEQVALYFFMLSHFVADACMPCHSDVRRLAGYSRGLHNKLESEWSKLVGTRFDKKKLLPASLSISPNQILKNARDVDSKFDNMSFAKAIPNLVAGDVWLEVINICRGSFAVASIIVSPKKYPYAGKKNAPFATVFGNADSQKFKAMSKMVMHDAVLNNAIIWRHIWKKASKT
ncbi:MAG: hypothetical protein ACYTBS_26795 [Planctomycetota bacterium]|jgi:hypothetical protein